MSVDELEESKKAVGAIYPILKTPKGEIIDGRHRQKVKGWKVEILPIENPLQILRVRVHANMFRREISRAEKEGWISEAFRLLEAKYGRKPILDEVADTLSLSRSTVNLYHRERQHPEHPPHVPMSYFRPCAVCGSTSKLCNPGCTCQRCKALENAKSAPAVDYDRQPILELRLGTNGVRNFTVNIPQDVCRKLGWQGGDTLYASIVGKSMTLIKK